MLFREVIVLIRKNYAKHVNELCGKIQYIVILQQPVTFGFKWLSDRYYMKHELLRRTGDFCSPSGTNRRTPLVFVESG